MTEQSELMDKKHQQTSDQIGQRAAVQMATQADQHQVKNPEFLKQLQDADLDTDLFDWVEDELGPLVSGAHILGERSPHYEEQQLLLNMNKAERMVAERTPGRLLRENPLLLALSQGITGTKTYPDPREHPKFRKPITPRKERVIRDAMEVITNRETMSIDGAGRDAASNATVENRSVTNEEKESGGIKSRAKEVFR